MREGKAGTAAVIEGKEDPRQSGQGAGAVRNCSDFCAGTIRRDEEFLCYHGECDGASGVRDHAGIRLSSRDRSLLRLPRPVR